MHRTPHRRSPLYLAIVLTALLPAAALHAQAGKKPKTKTKTTVQASPSAQQTAGIVRDTLGNGIPVYFFRHSDVPLAEISVLFDAGARTETPAQAGVARLALAQLLSGTGTRGAQAISDARDMLAARISTYCDDDYAQIYAQTLARSFRGTVELLADVCRNPSYPERVAQAAGRRMRDDAAASALSLSDKASLALLARVCGVEHLSARSPAARVAHADSLTAVDLLAFHRARYRPETCTILVTGALDRAFVRTVLQEFFGSWPREGAAPRVPDVPPPPAEPAVLLLADSTIGAIAQYRVGVQAVPRNDPDHAAALVLAAVLGQGEHNRLRTALWETRLLSPAFTATCGYSIDRSYLVVSGTAPAQKADSILLQVDAVLRDLSTQGVTEEEVRAAVRELTEALPLRGVTNAQLLLQLKDMVVYDCADKTFDAAARSLRAVTAAQVSKLAARLFTPGAVRIVVAGDPGILKERLAGRSFEFMDASVPLH